MSHNLALLVCTIALLSKTADLKSQMCIPKLDILEIHNENTNKGNCLLALDGSIVDTHIHAAVQLILEVLQLRTN